jgi:hypothetical protein
MGYACTKSSTRFATFFTLSAFIRKSFFNSSNVSPIVSQHRKCPIPLAQGKVCGYPVNNPIGYLKAIGLATE